MTSGLSSCKKFAFFIIISAIFVVLFIASTSSSSSSSSSKSTHNQQHKPAAPIIVADAPIETSSGGKIQELSKKGNTQPEKTTTTTTNATTPPTNKNNDQHGFTFQIYGKVQKVSFRRFTSIQANKLGLIGWIQNSSDGTKVVGEVTGGTKEKREELRQWLMKVGSPKSRIDRWEFGVLEEEKGLELRRRLGDTFVIKK